MEPDHEQVALVRLYRLVDEALLAGHAKIVASLLETTDLQKVPASFVVGLAMAAHPAQRRLEPRWVNFLARAEARLTAEFGADRAAALLARVRS